MKLLAMKEDLRILRIEELRDSPWQSRILDENQSSDTSDEPKKPGELTDSISRSGQITPIIVRQKDGFYEIIDGHRRVIAHKNLGLDEIKAIVTDVSDKEAQSMSVIGNLQRRNLRPIELAMAYRKILDAGLYSDKKELSSALGKDETYVGDVLNTLNMDSRVIEDLSKNNTIRDLKILRAIRKSAPVDENKVSDSQWELYRRIADEGLTREGVKAILKNKSKLSYKPWKTKSSVRTLDIKISMSKMNPGQKETLQRLIDEKIAEIFENL